MENQQCHYEKDVKIEKVPDTCRERTSVPYLGKITEAVQLLLEGRPCFVCHGACAGDLQGCI